MKIYLILLFSFFLLISCKNENEEILVKSDKTFSEAESEVVMSGYIVNIDSFRRIYKDLKIEDAKKASEFANKFERLASDLKNKNQFFLDSLKVINEKEDERRQVEYFKKIKLSEKEWNFSKAGKIQKRFPNWTREECEKISKNKIWIGMKLEMLKYLRGNPDSANPSNYGDGNKWQWCWDDYSPRCFYGAEDQIITAYN